MLTTLVLAAAASSPKIVIAHRGASGYLPEHTLVAEAAAHAMGADFIEPDVVLSKDGVPVVLHDIHLETTTDVARVFPARKRDDGRYYAIDFTLAELRTLAVHERLDEKTGKAAFPTRFPPETAILRIPTLEETIMLVQGLNRSTGKNVGLYPEVKAPAFHTKEGQDIAKITLETLKKHGLASRDSNVYVQCFDPAALKRMRTELKAEVKLVQLIGDNSWGEADTDYTKMLTEDGLKAIKEYADGIGPWLPQVLAGDPKDPTNAKKVKATPLVKTAHKLGLVVHPYTARADQLPPFAKNFDELLRKVYVEAGADGLFTDHADQAVAFLKGQKLRK